MSDPLLKKLFQRFNQKGSDPFIADSLIAIIDYGMGNLTSVAKALDFLGAKATVTSDPKVISRAKGLVFPGVGAFGGAMRELKKRGLIDPIVGAVAEGRPFLGLCLGLQLLFEASEESPGVKGLGLLAGRVRRLPARMDLKVPHMGWNQIHRTRRDDILKGVPEGAFMYFVHSYVAEPSLEDLTVATTEYGRRFPSVISQGKSLWATQFHPEKSQRWGLRILKNFIQRVALC